MNEGARTTARMGRVTLDCVSPNRPVRSVGFVVSRRQLTRQSSLAVRTNAKAVRQLTNFNIRATTIRKMELFATNDTWCYSVGSLLPTPPTTRLRTPHRPPPFTLDDNPSPLESSRIAIAVAIFVATTITITPVVI